MKKRVSLPFPGNVRWAARSGSAVSLNYSIPSSPECSSPTGTQCLAVGAQEILTVLS